MVDGWWLMVGGLWLVVGSGFLVVGGGGTSSHIHYGSEEGPTL